MPKTVISRPVFVQTTTRHHAWNRPREYQDSRDQARRSTVPRDVPVATPIRPIGSPAHACVEPPGDQFVRVAEDVRLGAPLAMIAQLAAMPAAGTVILPEQLARPWLPRLWWRQVRRVEGRRVVDHAGQPMPERGRRVTCERLPCGVRRGPAAAGPGFGGQIARGPTTRQMQPRAKTSALIDLHPGPHPRR